MNSISRITRSKQGQSLIELTLVFPLLLALVYGAIEIGAVISTYLTLTHTTREGANLASRGTNANLALDAVVTAAAPTLRNDNLGQWRIIYSQIVQDSSVPCLPGQPCTYKVGSQIIRGALPETTKIGRVSSQVTIPGIDSVGPGQTFHAFELYYDYGPNVITYVGKSLADKIFYDRTIFTDVSGNL